MIHFVFPLFWLSNVGQCADVRKATALSPVNTSRLGPSSPIRPSATQQSTRTNLQFEARAPICQSNASAAPTSNFALHLADTQGDRLFWEKLTAGGGKEVQCGWLADKYGLFWQIVPAKFFAEWVNDVAGLKRVMHKMIQMTKLDLAKLQKAFAEK